TEVPDASDDRSPTESRAAPRDDSSPANLARAISRPSNVTSHTCWPLSSGGSARCRPRRSGAMMSTLELGAQSAITTGHRARMAFVYVRQSSVSQVTRHAESTDLQYGLVERAVRLGWPRERVAVIDDDLGKSAGSSSERDGFRHLIAEIGLGHGGLVVSL